ncbi:uncharacterized protein MONBRDRAFT_24696 [Monosiga brevicollis MX1]|uniref:Inward rectifier potassium channel C-terminal domain-containing protein n=1 Tax=Monosiga brevicollis TaxID=81824 RepID=A9UX72_MONBE|nr:uncharacterized protein MONBRDRAFT_24696 [Monosiga brevicollis MX1]EDQ90340.1 predicted protein [Monosiga brevicollis MX1]|eukprot:XP_001745107.1 hypothetical protein [Monosiga brevicollis MX1]
MFRWRQRPTRASHPSLETPVSSRAQSRQNTGSSTHTTTAMQLSNGARTRSRANSNERTGMPQASATPQSFGRPRRSKEEKLRDFAARRRHEPPSHNPFRSHHQQYASTPTNAPAPTITSPDVSRIAGAHPPLIDIESVDSAVGGRSLAISDSHAAPATHSSPPSPLARPTGLPHAADNASLSSDPEQDRPILLSDPEAVRKAKPDYDSISQASIGSFFRRRRRTSDPKERPSDNEKETRKDKPTDRESDKEHREGGAGGLVSRLKAFVRNKNSSIPHTHAANGNKKRTRHTVQYNQHNPVFTKHRGPLDEQNEDVPTDEERLAAKRPRLKHVPLLAHRTFYSIKALARTVLELLGMVVALAFVFAIILVILDVDRRGNSGQDASFLECFMVLGSILLTGSDDLAPVRLKMTTTTYLLVTTCYFVGFFFRVAYLAGYLARLRSSPTFFSFSTWLVVDRMSSFVNGPALEIRVGYTDAFKHKIIQGHAQVTLSREPKESEVALRRYHQLKLLTANMAVMPPLWTLAHAITPNSPLAGITWDKLAREDVTITVVISGIDAETGTAVYQSHTYIVGRMLVNAKFHNMVTQPDGLRRKRKTIDFAFFDTVDVEYPVNR